jgi:transposase
MSVRILLTDNAWEPIATILAVSKPPAGSPPLRSDRMCLAAVLSVARPGLPWRDRPAACGRWDAVYHRFRRGERRGVWRHLGDRGPRGAFKVAQALCLDSTLVRAHPPAAGAFKKMVARRPRLGDALGGDCPPTSMRAREPTRPGCRSSAPEANVMRPRASRPLLRHCPKNRRSNRPSGTAAMTVITGATLSTPRA